MSSRKPGYLFGVILLAALLSLPQVLWCIGLVFESYQTNRLPIPIPGLRETAHYASRLNQAMFWRDQFVDMCGHADATWNTTSNWVWRLESLDPETGVRTSTVNEPIESGSCTVMSFGERLWVIDHSSPKTFEVVGNQLQSSTFVLPNAWPDNGQRLLIDGEPAFIKNSNHNFSLWKIIGGIWTETDEIVLPSAEHEWNVGSSHVNFQRATMIWCLNQGDQIHVLLAVDGCLLYRSGLVLRPVSTNSDDSATAADSTADDPAENNDATLADEAIAGWSLVYDSRTLAAEFPTVLPTIRSNQVMFVDGRPVALVAYETRPGQMVGELYQYESGKWSHFAKHTFRFGTDRFKTATCADAQKSYIVASTSLGVEEIYAVEANGVRLTAGGSSTVPSIQQDFRFFFLIVPLAFLVLGVVLGCGVWFLMWWYTLPDYGFGADTVNLASLGQRGLARLIDLSLLLGSIIGIDWALTPGFDWLTLAEALNLRLDHPSIHFASRVALILASWLTFALLLLIVIQGRWGLTPGKWCCGILVLRSTLRPCGFACSLAREIVLCADACNLICWTPGILSIALTDYRQRLGDLVADTIVVDKRSLLGDRALVTAIREEKEIER